MGYTVRITDIICYINDIIEMKFTIGQNPTLPAIRQLKYLHNTNLIKSGSEYDRCELENRAVHIV